MSTRRKVSTHNGQSAGSDSNISLGSTFDAFETRLQRKLKEQEKKEDVCQRRKEERHTRMLKAMTTIRKALQDTCKIKLGERFSFDLDVTDWQGWPKVELSLIDAVAPERKDYGLVVSANDRNDKGTIVLGMVSGKALARVHLSDPTELKRLPLILKKTVRDFLDTVADYVLNPKNPEDLLDVQTRIIETNELDPLDSVLQNTDVFSDDVEGQQSQNVIQVEEEDQSQKEVASLIEENVFE